MTRDIVLVTVESLRYDERDACPVFDDLDTVEGVAAGHYTRPSLAAMCSGQYRAALETRVSEPTLATVLRDAGYTTLGVSYSPQTTPAFGFGTGFDDFDALAVESGRVSRGSWLRERLGESRLVRAVHERLQPKHATLARLPRDTAVVDTALGTYHDADGPRFLWVHLMGSHRPYGWGDDALPERLGATAARAGPGRLAPSLPQADHETVVEHYRAGVERTGRAARDLLDGVADDALTIVVGDHGEELGEDGYYFHGGYRRRTVDALSRVPVGTRNMCLDGRVGLAALPHAIATHAGVTPPTAWVPSTDASWLTLAPWAGAASVRWTTSTGGWTLRDAAVADIEEAAVSRSVQEHLSALGYR